MFLLFAEIGNRMMRLIRSVGTSSTMVIFRVLVFITLASFTLSVLMLSLVLVLSDSSWMQEHYPICRVDLKPVVCELGVMTRR